MKWRIMLIKWKYIWAFIPNRRNEAYTMVSHCMYFIALLKAR